MKTNTPRYALCVPSVPGCAPVRLSTGNRLVDMRYAASFLSERRDLAYQDVRIERITGELVEYAGPCR